MRYPTRKPNALPPKTKTIQKFSNGGNVREERLDERLERLLYEYEDGPKPKHYDDPRIIDSENFKRRPVPFNNNDSSTFPSNRNQRQRMNTWELMLETAKGNPKEMKEIRSVLRDAYKSNPKSLTTQELKMIGQYKSPKPVEEKPIINTSFDNLKIINQIIERQKPKEVAAAAPIRKPVQRGGLDADFVQEKLTIGKVLNGEKF
jgi:hypothetical protein